MNDNGRTEASRIAAKRAGRRWHYITDNEPKAWCGVRALRLNRPTGSNDLRLVTCGACKRIIALRAGIELP